MAAPGKINLSGTLSVQRLFDFGRGNPRWYRINNLGRIRMMILQDDQTYTSSDTFALEPGLSADFYAWRLTVMRDGQSNAEGTFEML